MIHPSPSPPRPSPSPLCDDLPRHVSTFVDAFVDFAVSGLFFPSTTSNAAATTFYPAPRRLVAIGDLHGDLQKAQESLALAGLIDSSRRWCSAPGTVAVQVGDVLDRGSDEIPLLYYLHKLKLEAQLFDPSSALITLLGNHETMNMAADFRFVTPSSLRHFLVWSRWHLIGSHLKSLCPGAPANPADADIFRGIPRRFHGVRPEFHAGFRARIAALRPGGPLARRFLAQSPVVAVVGDSVFVHGGLLRQYVDYGLDRINREARDWVLGRVAGPPSSVIGPDSLVWLRRFSQESEAKCDCSALEQALETIPGARRMVMGHTIQMKGINGVCGNRAIRIDVGMSRGCGDGLPEVLEIEGVSDRVAVLSENSGLGRRRLEVKEDKVGLGVLVSDHGMKQVKVNA